MILTKTLLVAAGADPFHVLESAFMFGWNQFVNKHDPNNPAQGIQGGPANAPVTVDVMHFPRKTTGKVPKPYTPGHCYHNALQNHDKYGMPIVVGFAVPKDTEGKGYEGTTDYLAKHGKLSRNPLYRGYEHAWNLDKTGAVVDSTYHSHDNEYEYHGKVVHPVTAAGFKNDADVMAYAEHVSSGGRYPHDRSSMKYRLGRQKFASTYFPSPSVHHDRLVQSRWTHHSSSHWAGHDSHIYTHPKYGKLNMDIRDGNITSLSRSYPTKVEREHTIHYGGSPIEGRNYGGTFGDFFTKYAKPDA